MSTSIFVVSRGQTMVPPVLTSYDYYVDGARPDDSGNGLTLATAKKTMAAGLALLSAGKILGVRGVHDSFNGQYVIGNNFQFESCPNGTNWTTGLVRVRGYNSEVVTLVATGAGAHIIRFGGAREYISIEDMVIDGSVSGGLVGVKFENLTNHCRIKNLEVKNCTESGSHGVHLPGAAGEAGEFNEIINCHIHNGGSRAEFDHGIYQSATNTMIDGCTVHDWTGWGIHRYSDGDNTTIKNCTVYNQVAAGFNGGIRCDSSNTGHQVFNNVVYDCTTGIAFNYGCAGSYAWNNTTDGNSNGLYSYNAGTGNVFENNLSTDRIFFEGGTNSIVVNHCVASSLDDSLSLADTSGGSNDFDGTYAYNFTNQAGHDYTLASGSAAINTGKNTGIGVDKDGNTRPFGAAYDIGAYERQS